MDDKKDIFSCLNDDSEKSQKYKGVNVLAKMIAPQYYIDCVVNNTNKALELAGSTFRLKSLSRKDVDDFYVEVTENIPSAKSDKVKDAHVASKEIAWCYLSLNEEKIYRTAPCLAFDKDTNTIYALDGDTVEVGKNEKVDALIKDLLNKLRKK